MENSNLHIDGTYKLTIYEFPVIIIGISDINRKFYCSAICISELEDSKTFSWIIEKLSKGSEEFLVKKFHCKYAKQISTAIKNYDSRALRNNCWVYTYRLISASLKISPASLKSDAEKEIFFFFQSLTSLTLFKEGISLF
ncbi:hypothetical protein DMUE_0716 [Dictyocoela muelleri]|nr:hypothetical protein DMUE_0716 [Dictyocoela muelleri]